MALISIHVRILHRIKHRRIDLTKSVCVEIARIRFTQGEIV